MRRTDTGEPPAAPGDRLDELSARHPEWAPWVELYRETLALRDRGDMPAVRRSARGGGEATDGPATAGGEPVLHGVVLRLSSDAVLRFVERRLHPATGDRETLQPGDAGRLLEAAIAGDRESMEALAKQRGADAARLGAVTDLAVLPVLLEVSRLAGEPPPDWPHGYCPTCGAWPALAELLGLEGERRLRCARCGTGWRRDILHCVFCGERDHRQLRTLADEGREDREWIDACDSCRGYTKSFARLSSMPAEEIILEDLASVELDIVALERGYRRPATPGHAACVRLEVDG